MLLTLNSYPLRCDGPSQLPFITCLAAYLPLHFLQDVLPSPVRVRLGQVRDGEILIRLSTESGPFTRGSLDDIDHC